MTELDRHLLDLTNALQGWAFAYSSLLYLLFLGAFVGLYARLRSVAVPTGWPDRGALSTLLVATVVPTTLVGATAVLASVSDVDYVIVSDTAIPWFATWPIVYVAATLWVLVGVLTAVGLFHVVVQSELRARTSPTAAMLAATAIGATLLATQGLTFGFLGGGRGYPVWGEYLAILALVAALGLAVGGVRRADQDWQRYAAVVPLAVLAVGTVAQFLGVLDNGALVGSPIEWAVPGLATVSFGITAFAMVGLAAAAYERSESILAPVLVYAVTYATSAVAVLVVDVGTTV